MPKKDELRLSSSRITLMGAPVPYKDKTSKMVSLLKRPEIKTAAISSLFVIVAGTVFRTPNIGTDVCFYNLAVASVYFHDKSYILGKAFSESAINNKHIETKPDSKTPPTIDKYATQAKLLRRKYLAYSVGAPVVLVAMNYCLTPTPKTMAYSGIFLSITLARHIAGFQRWNEVLKGNWIVVDKAPLKERTKISATVKNKAGKLKNAAKEALTPQTPLPNFSFSRNNPSYTIAATRS